MTKARFPTPKLGRRGRFIYLSIAGGVLVATLLLHFGYFPRFSETPSIERLLMAEGRVIRKNSLRDKEGRVVTRITYRFRTPDGTSVEGRASRKGGGLEAIRPGDKVRVIYSESDPLRNRLAADAPMGDTRSAGSGSNSIR